MVGKTEAQLTAEGVSYEIGVADYQVHITTAFTYDCKHKLRLQLQQCITQAHVVEVNSM
jgi:hypothetical protein